MTDHQTSLPALAKIRIFNPHRLDEEELEQSFVARQETFRAILDDVVASDPAGPPQHHLLIGQRGMGKTMLLLRLGLELQRPPHHQRFLPLRFPEEQYVEVDRLAKFWLNCLDSTADALEHRGETELVRSIDATVARLANLKTDDASFQEQCRDAFSAVCREVGRRPVLLVDNFNQLLARLRKEDFALRGFFTAGGAPLLVGASAVYPTDLDDYGAAFYDGFKTHYLHPLELEEIRDVIVRLARASGRDDLVSQVYQRTPRLAALRELTGGNPRTAVLLFELFARGFSEDAFEDLEALLDVITPLYQSRLDQLSDQSQTIVGVLARNWAPMSKAQIAEKGMLNDSSVPAQLGRLRDVGLVEETAVFPGKKSGYQIAERFFNIWYLMRFSTRRQRAGLSNLAHFLEDFHTPDERLRSARELLGRQRLSQGNIMYAMALADTLASEPSLAGELASRAQLELIELCEGIPERIAKILDPEEIPRKMYDFAELKRRLADAVPNDSPVSGKEFAALVLGSPVLVPGIMGRSLNFDRHAIAAKRLSAQKVTELMTFLQGEVQKLGGIVSRDAVRWLRSKLARGSVTSWEDGTELSALIHLATDDDQAEIARMFASPVAKRALEESAFQHLIALLQIQPHAQSLAEDWFVWGNALTEFARYEEAEQAYREAIQRDPNDARPWFNLGFVLQEYLGRHEEAEQAYREAIRFDSDNVAAWNNLGTLLCARPGRYEDAEQAYREAIRLDPKDARSWVNLGSVLQEYLGRHEEAEQAYREAIRLDSDNVAVWNNLGTLLGARPGRYEDAEQAYREAIRLDPKDGRVWNNLGHLLRARPGRYEEAEQAYREAIRLDSDNAAAWNNLGDLLHDCLGRYEEAEQAYREAIRLAPKDVRPWNNLANLLDARLGRYEEAEQAYREAIRLHPKDGRVWNNLGHLLGARLGRYEEAEQAYREAIRLDPSLAFPWFNLGNLLQNDLGRHEEAEQAYREAIRLDPKDVRVWNNLGKLLRDRLSRYEEAEQAYREAIRLDSDNAAAWNNLGDLLDDCLGRYEEAEQAYREAIRLAPKDVRPWNNLGNLLDHRLGRYEEAEQAYREAIRLAPKDARPWNNLGNLLGDRLGRYEEAEQAYREAIRLDPKNGSPWNNLGTLLVDHVGRYEEAEQAYLKAVELDPNEDAPRHNLVFLVRDIQGDIAGARRVLGDLKNRDTLQDTQALHEALFAAYDDNWGLAAESIRKALAVAGGRLPPTTRDDWFRASAVLLHLGFGEKLVRLLEEEKAATTLLPWFEAVRAHALGDRRHLVNLPLEARPVAETIFDQIERMRRRLPPRQPK